MRDSLVLDLLPQPDDVTCGPTCLQAVYRYWEDDITLDDVIAEVPQVATGGTLDVLLANHALQRGYDATIYTFNMQLFDPSWFFPRKLSAPELSAKLRLQAQSKGGMRLQLATDAYCQYLELGGAIEFQDLTRVLLRRFLKNKIPILTGLSSTFLYRLPREDEQTMIFDDIKGSPEGHFVVLTGYSEETNEVYIADPFEQNPYSPELKYTVHVDRVICAILLGILTYDANFLIIKPKES